MNETKTIKFPYVYILANLITIMIMLLSIKSYGNINSFYEAVRNAIVLTNELFIGSLLIEYIYKTLFKRRD
jgi:hypothetical protein